MLVKAIVEVLVGVLRVVSFAALGSSSTLFVSNVVVAAGVASGVGLPLSSENGAGAELNECAEGIVEEVGLDGVVVGVVLGGLDERLGVVEKVGLGGALALEGKGFSGVVALVGVRIELSDL